MVTPGAAVPRAGRHSGHLGQRSLWGRQQLGEGAVASAVSVEETGSETRGPWLVP